MIKYQMTFLNNHAFSPRQLMQYFTPILPNRAINFRFSFLWNKYNMTFTIPAGMGQTLIISHRFTSLFSLVGELKVRVIVISIKPMRASPAELGFILSLIK